MGGVIEMFTHILTNRANTAGLVISLDFKLSWINEILHLDPSISLILSPKLRWICESGRCSSQFKMWTLPLNGHLLSTLFERGQREAAQASVRANLAQESDVSKAHDECSRSIGRGVRTFTEDI